MQTQGAIGNLINRYRAVLKKCRLLNVFGSLAVAGLLVMGGAGVAGAKISQVLSSDTDSFDTTHTYSNNSNTATHTTTDGYTNVYGGAFFITGGTHNLTIDSAEELRGNTAQATSGESAYGGAIAVYDGSLTTTGVDFINNKAYGPGVYSGGGAIWGSTTATITVNGGTFEGNSSTYAGGAIKADKAVSISNAEFIGNTAETGGAISGSDTTKTINITSSYFEGNTATSDFGGAICVLNSELILSGENIFTKNTANGSPNDIYNMASDVKIEGGATDMQSGYVQRYGTTTDTDIPSLTVGSNNSNNLTKLSIASIDLGANDSFYTTGGTVTVTKGGMLGNGTANMAELDAAIAEAQANGVDTSGGAYVGKTSLDLSKASMGVGTPASTASGEVAFAADSALVVDQTALNGTPAFANVTSASMDNGSALHVQNAVAGQELTIFSSKADSSGKTGISNPDNVSITTDNKLVTFDKDALLGSNNGQPAVAQLADVSSVVPGLSPELAPIATAVALGEADDTQPGTQFVRRAFHPDLSAAETEATLESATRAAAVAGVPHMTWAAQKAANAAVTQRTSLAAPASAGLQAVAADGSVQIGASAGDGLKNGFAMWIMPLYQSWNAWGMEGGNLDMDVNGALGGLAVGADYTFAHAFRAGITVNMGGGYAEGSGDFQKTTNNFTFWGLGAYLGWSKNNFGLTADINHTWVYNDVEQDVLHAMQMDSLKSDITSRALSVGLRGEYKLETNALDITPHVGVRYTHLTTDKYGMESKVFGGDVTNVGDVHQDIWTFPIGVAFSKDVQMDSGWYVKPSLDVAVIPAAGDIKARSDVRYTIGRPVTAEVSTQTMDYISYMGQAGLEFGNDNVKLGVNYNLQMGAQSTAHGVFGTLRYEF